MIGTRILHYKVIEKIGEGGMGVVYKAEDSKLGRTVALKFMPPDISNSPRYKELFIREAQTIAALDHPNLCTIHAIEESTDGRLFIAMACYDGETLGKRIERETLAISDVVEITAAVADGMKTAHEKGIIHRDIKPANIFLVKDGPVKVVDFGLAKWAGSGDLTRSGVTLGTTPYMSPEQTRGEDLDPRADIWALGVVLYEMLTGRRPFEGDYEQAVVYAIQNEEPARISEFRHDVPSELERVVARAMSKDRKDRYRTAAELLDDLSPLRYSGKAATDLRAPSRAVPSIAVLPFTNLSPDPENEYFGDGLAEELINALARLEGIRVVARTSAFRFRDSDRDIRDIGSQLNVGAVLEGSVRRSGDTLRITTQLIDAADGFHMWSERYERQMADIFAIQDDITRAIMGELRVKLAGTSDAPLVERYTENLEAYNLYLKGKHYLTQLSPEGWAKGLQCFERALDLDPSFARAYGMLCHHYGSQVFWGDLAPSTAFPRAKAAVRKALELDETLARAHGCLAVVHFSYDWDDAAAESEFARTFELDPDSGLDRINYALFLMTRKRFEQAAEQAKLAVDLDPLSSMVGTWAAMVPAYAGNPGKSRSRLLEVIEFDPEYWQPYHHLAFSYLCESNWDAAVESAKRAVDLSRESPAALERLGIAYYRMGLTAEGDGVLERLRERERRGWVAPSVFYLLHLSRGDEDEAYRHLERAVAERDPWLGFYGTNPQHLRSKNPRFDRLIRPTGLPV